MSLIRQADRLLMNPWVSRVGNAFFIAGALLLLYRRARSEDPLWLAVFALIGVGVLLMALPYIERQRHRKTEAESLRRKGAIMEALRGGQSPTQKALAEESRRFQFQQEARQFFLDSLVGEKTILKSKLLLAIDHGSDDAYFRSVGEAWTKVREHSAKVSKRLREQCGSDVASLYDSDHGLDPRYEGPAYSGSQQELELFVIRRSLRIDEIISKIRAGHIQVRPPRKGNQ